MAGKFPVRATPEQVRLLEAKAGGSDRAEADRARSILLTLRGWTSSRLSEAFGVREDTVRLWRSQFMNGGVDALETRPLPGPEPMKTQAALRVAEPLLSAPRRGPGGVGLGDAHCGDGPYARWLLVCGLSQPLRTMITIEEGERLRCLRWREGRWVLSSPASTQSLRHVIPTHMAIILVCRTDTGEPLDVMDGRLMTRMRTAAAAKRLARRAAGR
jgi:hypothetical protein